MRMENNQHTPNAKTDIVLRTFVAEILKILFLKQHSASAQKLNVLTKIESVLYAGLKDQFASPCNYFIQCFSSIKFVTKSCF